MNILGNNWENPISRERLELVFQQRNHDYGAYTLRRDYSRTVVSAFIFTCSLLLLLAGIPALLALLYPEKSNTGERLREVVVELSDLSKPDIIQPERLPEPVKPLPTPPAGRQFSNLIVTDQDSSDNVLTQDALLKTLVSTKTNDKDSSDLPDPQPDPLPDANATGSTKTYIWVEEMPAFPGGENAMLRYLAGNIRYPAPARERQLSGTVFISFTVDREGNIRDIELLKGIGGGCEEEALRVIRSMPKWKPGKQNGQTVNVQYKLPVSFKIQ
ncbi:MAG: energy transducer TonB [Bacteroidia bacterium]|nr:energy transducer TonB [Bacteroidia bacterium]